MLFIGIVASKKCFENVKRKMEEKIKNKAISFIQINLRSIENVKNIKFETIVIEDNVKKFEKHKELLEKMLQNAEYLIINTDKNQELKKLEELSNAITYGLNQKATVTVSSISETDILIYWQKSLPNKVGNSIEIEERRIKKEEKEILKTYEILIIYTLLKIYNKSIMEKI